MSKLLAIDPGLSASGYSIWEYFLEEEFRNFSSLLRKSSINIPEHPVGSQETGEKEKFFSVPGVYFRLLEYGDIKTKPQLEIGERLAFIVNSFNNLLQKEKIHKICLEEPYVNTNFRTSMKLGMALGSIIAAAGLHNIPILLYSPSTVKSCFAGNGRAEKHHMEEKAKIYLKEKVSDHVVDSIGIAYTFFCSR